MNGSRTSDTVTTGCEWKQNDEGFWDTGCGNIFTFNDGGPIDNDIKFCCYCGLRLDELPYEEPDEEEDDE